MTHTTLRDWGWDDAWSESAEAHGPGAAEPTRVVGQERGRWSIQTAHGAREARISTGRRSAALPVVGDWILAERGPFPVDPWSVTAVLPRRSAFSRGAAGSGDAERVLAANVDLIWIVHGLDTPVNARRLERSLAMAWESGAVPEVVLTKADLAADLEAAIAEAQTLGMGVTVRWASTEDEGSVAALRRTLRPRCTVVLVGPSGAGKSTLVNLLGMESLADVGAVRDRGRKGRHTTSRRELYRIPGEALLLDTPGIRELRVWTLGDGLDQAFPEIHDLAEGCHFADRLAGFRKLHAEAEWQLGKPDGRAQKAALSEHKSALKTMKCLHKLRGPE